MSTSTTTGLNTAVKYTLPALSILLGSMALLGGAYTVSDPDEGARLFGIPLTSATDSTSLPKAYVRGLGIRNFSSGVTILSLTGFYGIARWQGLYVASTAIKRCLGIAIFAGMSVGLADSWLIGRYIEETGGVGVEEDTRDKANGHMFVAPFIGLTGLGWLIT